jgi:hypothetical protein
MPTGGTGRADAAVRDGPMKRRIVALLVRLGILATPAEDQLYSYMDEVLDGSIVEDPYVTALLAHAARESRAVWRLLENDRTFVEGYGPCASRLR